MSLLVEAIHHRQYETNGLKIFDELENSDQRSDPPIATSSRKKSIKVGVTFTSSFGHPFFVAKVSFYR